MALFYLPLLCVICADGACSDCAFATRVLLIAPLLIVLLLTVPLLTVPLFMVPVLIQPCSSASLPLWARPGPQVRYTLAMRYYQAHLTI